MEINRVPEDAALKKQWMDIVESVTQHPIAGVMKLCSLHFEDMFLKETRAYGTNKLTSRKLENDAYPTLFQNVIKPKPKVPPTSEGFQPIAREL